MPHPEQEIGHIYTPPPPELSHLPPLALHLPDHESIILPQSTKRNPRNSSDSKPVPFAIYGDLFYGRLPAKGRYSRFRKNYTSSHREKPVGAYKITTEEEDEDARKTVLKYEERVAVFREKAEEYRCESLSPGTREIYDIRVDEVIEAEGFEGRAKNGNRYFYVFPDEEYKLNYLTNPGELNGAADQLAIRQSVAEGKTNPDEILTYQPLVPHNEILKNLLANRNEITRHCYKEEPVLEDQLRSWVEVNLNDYGIIFQRGKNLFRSQIPCGQADLVVEGPDNQSIEFEAGAPIPRKVDQTNKHNVALQAVIKDANHDHPSPPVTSFIASFWEDTDADEYIIQFLSPEEIPYVPMAN